MKRKKLEPLAKPIARKVKDIEALAAKMSDLLNSCKTKSNEGLGSPCVLAPKSASQKGIARNRMQIHAAFHKALSDNGAVYMRCNSKRCVSPKHMWVNPSLLPEQVANIRNTLQKSAKSRDIEFLATEYEVDTGSILNILNGTGAYKDIVESL